MRPWVPRSFDLMHRRVTVKLDEGIHAHENNIGQARHAQNQIVMAPHLMDSKMYHASETASVFWHEVWHHMMKVLAEDEFNLNEKLADQFGGLMAQLMQTADWRPPEK
jgi:hypothetical protein